MTFLRKIFRGDDQEAKGTAPLPELASAEQVALAPEPGAPSEDSAAEPPAASGTDWWQEPAPIEPAEAITPPAGTRTQTAPLQQPSEQDDGTRPLSAADRPQIAALRSRQGLAASAQRDIGRVRSVNQDSVFALITTIPREGSDLTIGLFVVADGMGGHEGGDVASRLAVSTVARHVLAHLVVPALNDGATEALQPLIIAAVQEANRAIWEQAQALGTDMGTTCTVALLLGQAVYVGHVGDSRAYLATPTGLRHITTDHSAVGRLIQLGQLDPSEAREHPLRSQLYRTVGQTPEVQVDFYYQQLGNATHLLLCSDGLWGMIGEDVLEDVLEHALWPHDACRELIARANLAGGEDNISAVVVTLPTN